MVDIENKDPIDPTIQTPEKGTEENPDLKKGKEEENGENGEHQDPPKPEDLEKDPKDPIIDPPATVTPPVDYRGKFSDSTRRNQIVESQLAELQKTLTDITKQEIPTEEEMRLLDKDWEYRSDFEKNQAIKTVVLEKRLNLVTNTLGNISKEQTQSSQILTFIENEERLKGKEDEFYKFATAKKNAGANIEVLLNAFLFEVKDIVSDPKDPTPPEPTVPENAPTLNRSTPSGGNPPMEKEHKLTDEEIKVIRTTDSKRYMKMVRNGEI